LFSLIRVAIRSTLHSTCNSALYFRLQLRSESGEELKEPRVFKLGHFVQLTATIPVPVTLARVTRLLKEPNVVKVVQFVQFRDTVATPPDENRSVANTGKEPSVVKAVQFVQEIRMPVVAVKLGVVRHRSQFRKCPQVVNSGPQLMHVTLIKLAKVAIVSL